MVNFRICAPYKQCMNRVPYTTPRNSEIPYTCIQIYSRRIIEEMKVVFLITFIQLKLQPENASFKIIAFGRLLSLETIFPIFIALPDVGYWSCLYLVGCRKF